MADEDKSVVNEFCHLLEKSKQLFNGIGDLPQYGNTQWQSYFGRTFDVYTKLWKYQQQHRQVLDSKYHLKRWQIGEIASKIGQLYYHYYLRTSETNYLHEAHSFYSAIKMRGYYSKANREERPDLMVKKLRYYARFIVVSLLLKKMKFVTDLVRELQKQIDEYISVFQAEDQLEWMNVLSEVNKFIECDSPVAVIDSDAMPIVLSHRLTALNTPITDQGAPQYFMLQEILIVGSCQEQVKFSELTLDMFRMLQAMEREPQETLSVTSIDGPATNGRHSVENGERITRRQNPHKYLLYKPSYSQLNIFLATGFKELPTASAMLVYMSANGSTGKQRTAEDAAYDFGGIVTNSKKEEGAKINKKPSHLKEIHCLHPGDLYPYTRKPMFLIVDSNNSSAFNNFPNLFGQPLVCLLSPEQVPLTFQDQHRKGNLFTMFLYSPLIAFCYVSNITTLPMELWEKCQSHVERCLNDASKVLARSRNIDHYFIQFYGDDFLRLMLLRHIFCWIVLRLHRGFKGPDFYPETYPTLPEEVLQNVTLHTAVLDLAAMLDVRPLYAEFTEID